MRTTADRRVLLALLTVVGCGRPAADPARARGVLHLDPRLADGRSAAAVLADRERVLRTFEFADEQGVGRTEWRPDNAAWLPGTHGGAALRALRHDPSSGEVFAALVRAVPFEAREVDAVEVRLFSHADDTAVLRWKTAERQADVLPREMRIDVPTRVGEQTLLFPVGRAPGWRGRVTELRLVPCLRGMQSFEIVSIRFLEDAFAWGHQPSAEAGLDAGDGGLLGPPGDERRAWPTDLGVPLFARADVPLGARLLLEVALARNAVERGPVTVAVDVAPDAGGTPRWERLAEASLELDRGVAGWTPLEADLADRAGQALLLRFVAFGPGGAPDEAGEPLRAAVYFGAPVVVEPRPDGRPDVVLVTLDTLRVDALACYGGPVATPSLERVAARGVLFEDAYSAANSTLPSHTSILTGLPVPTHGVLDNLSTLAAEVRTLPEALRAAGYQTVAAVSVEHLQASWSGLGKGFDAYLQALPASKVDGALTVARVRAWLAAVERPRPLFLWVHLFDPHTPYDPPGTFLADYSERLTREGRPPPPRSADPPTIPEGLPVRNERFLAGVTNADHARFLYRAGVAYTDRVLGELLDILEGEGLLEGVVAVTADHGESLGEEDVWFAHNLLHPPVVHVPLVLSVPGGPRGVRTTRRVSNADLARTLVGHLPGVELDPTGADLLAPAAAGPGRRVWFVHAGELQVGFHDDEVHYFGDVKGDEPLDRVLDVGGAPIGSPERAAARCREAALGWLRQHSGGRRVRADVTRDERAVLEQLGYAGDE